MLPSPMLTGTATSTDFLHSWRTATRLSSMPNASATARRRRRAISSGFSRRWLTDGCATALTTDAFPPGANDIAISTVIGGRSGSCYGAVSVDVVAVGGAAIGKGTVFVDGAVPSSGRAMILIA